MEAAEIERSLAGCEFFRGLEQGDIKNIASICRVKTYETGEWVYQQGDFGEHLYIIAEGKVVLGCLVAGLPF
jgi:CRP-like cAMP-binding protein